jgi:hypothetical protein
VIVDAVLKGVEVDVLDVIRDKVECDDDEDVLEIAELLVEVIVDVEVFVDVVDIEKGYDDRGEREIVVVFVDVFDNVDVREGKISFTERYLISEGSIPLTKKRDANKSNILISNILLRFFPKPLVWFSGFLVFWFLSFTSIHQVPLIFCRLYYHRQYILHLFSLLQVHYLNQGRYNIIE